MTYTTDTTLTAEQMADARAIGEALIASGKGSAKARAAALDAFRAANRASRSRWGDDMHEIVKAHGISGATGGRG